ncbi:MAG: ATP-binding cassette domain-containing protein [Pirellula sp.]
MKPLLLIQNLTVGYGLKPVIEDLSLSVDQGEAMVIEGGNGSGKTTLLKAAFGLLHPWSKETRIEFETQAVSLTNPEPSALLNAGIVFVPQKQSVYDTLTVVENLRLTSRRITAESFGNSLTLILDQFPALRPLLHQRPERMSGGERQMLALSMALIQYPRLLLLDEPLAGLSSAGGQAVLSLLHQLNRNNDVSLIIVEHRLNEVLTIATRKLTMVLGKIVADQRVSKTINSLPTNF